MLCASCASAPPPRRTVLFLRTDLQFTDVWEATREVLEEEFPLGHADVTQRTITTGYRVDLDDRRLRWSAHAVIEQLDSRWAVRIATTAERLRGNEWKAIGVDDKTSSWLVRRIDERVMLRKGPPPPDPRIEAPPTLRPIELPR